MYDNILMRLSKSKFRSSFKSGKKYKNYIIEKGYSTIEKHAYDFINKRLAPSNIPNDGKQTPMSGHPVFIAQHATATCCRSCLWKWHKIKPDKNLSENEIKYIVGLIMHWIDNQMKM